MKTSRHAIGIAFSLAATTCSIPRLRLGRIIFRTTDDFSSAGVPIGSPRVSDSAGMILSKKSLPWLLISGIPRARAETTNLLSTGNCIGFGDFQRRRTRAGAGASDIRWRKSRRSDHSRWGPGDHGKDRTRELLKRRGKSSKNRRARELISLRKSRRSRSRKRLPARRLRWIRCAP